LDGTTAIQYSGFSTQKSIYSPNQGSKVSRRRQRKNIVPLAELEEQGSERKNKSKALLKQR
jgi:hypothetical protein